MKHIRGIKTQLEFKINKTKEIDCLPTMAIPTCCDDESNTSIKCLLDELSYSENDLGEIKRNLLKCKSGHYNHDKILNAYSNYNDGIGNPILFSYFIDFKGYLDYMRNILEDGSFINSSLSKKEKNETEDDYLKNKRYRYYITHNIITTIENFYYGYVNRIIDLCRCLKQ